ncbi:MAG: PA14 domain-containing protein, partial [Planctomycetales bacterium]
FFLRSDDGSKLLINGKELISNDGLHAPRELQGRVVLRRGGAPIQVEYFNGSAGGELNLEWKGPGFSRRKIQGQSFDLAETPPLADFDLSVEYTATKPVVFRRTLKVQSPNAWLIMQVGRNQGGTGDYELELRVDGKPLAEASNQQVDTKQSPPMQLVSGIWLLGDYVGRTVDLQIMIKPLGYPGHEIPALHIGQLAVGPQPVRSRENAIAKNLLGDWRLRGARSTIKRSFHNGLLAGGDGNLRLAADGSIAMRLRLPSGERKAGVGYVRRENNQLVFDYVNGGWTKDRARISKDGTSLIIQEEGDEQSWNLEFSRDELSSHANYAGEWELQADASEIHNGLHDGVFSGGGGRLSIGRDGGIRIDLRYPAEDQQTARRQSTTGQIILEGEEVIFRYDGETWSDDLAELHVGRKKLMLREKGNAKDWTLTFVKQ